MLMMKMVMCCWRSQCLLLLLLLLEGQPECSWYSFALRLSLPLLMEQQSRLLQTQVAMPSKALAEEPWASHQQAQRRYC
jgi:hypothetical protein